MGIAELLRFGGSCFNSASSRDCHCFQFAAMPDAHGYSEPVAQPYPMYSNGHAIPDGNCYPATEPYVGSDSSANPSGNARAAAQRTGAGDGFGISPHR